MTNFVLIVFRSQSPSTTTPGTPAPKPTSSQWCLPKAGVPDSELQSNLDYACSQSIDCSPINPGGACFEPNTLASHAAYAMNLYYQTFGKNPWNCDFAQTATLTSSNPSKLSIFGTTKASQFLWLKNSCCGVFALVNFELKNRFMTI